MQILQLQIYLSFLAVSHGNIALYKPTSQSSTSSNYRSSRAVDGKKLTNFHDESCTRTHYQSRPWWRVDLLESVAVGLVKITNRGDCCWTRLRDVQIRVGNSPSGPDGNSLCADSLGSLGRGETKEYLCFSPLTGRYVYVMLMVTDVLTLCEVEVYASGATAGPQTSLTGNIARGKPTAQSSNYFSCPNNICDGNSSRAIDGNLDADFHDGSCTHTKYQQNPWWKVDLQNREVVRKVSLTNRGDCCPERLRNVEVRVGDDGCSYSKNQLCQSFTGEVGAGMTIDLHCNRRGRFLFVHLRYKAYLTLCEVQVYAEKGASLPWTNGNVSCTKTSKKAGGSYGWIAGPVVAFFVCFCCGRGKRKSSQPPQLPQNANNEVVAADSDRPENHNDGGTQSQGTILRRHSAPLGTTDSSGDDDGSAFDASRSIPPVTPYLFERSPAPLAPPPSYQEAVQSTYDNAAFELEPASVNPDAYRNNLSSTPPPTYSSLQRSHSFEQR